MKKAIKILVSINPVLSLFCVTGCAIYYNYWSNEYLEAYTLLSDLFGFSILWVIGYFDPVRWYRYCSYTKVALIGLCLYSLINITYSTSKLVGTPLSEDAYITLFECVSLASICVLDFILILQYLWKRR